MSQIPKERQDERLKLYRELTFYDGEGIRLWLEGERSTPEEIVRACCAREGKSYMRDYVLNAEEKVTDIAFDPVDE